MLFKKNNNAKIMILILFITNFIASCQSFKCDDKVLCMNKSVKLIGDSVIIFKAEVIRNKDNPDEYYPNSERLRIEIFNNNGELIWNSNQDQVYFQSIGKVEPQNIGDTAVYEIEYNINDFKNKYFLNQEISVNFILPVKPKLYLENLKIKLK